MGGFAMNSENANSGSGTVRKIEDKPAGIASAVRTAVFLAVVFVALFLTQFISYPLFHSLAELFSVIVACAVFILAWNSRCFIDNRYFLFIGIAYLFVAFIDLIHTLTYKDMGVLPAAGPDAPIQLWIAARYLESLSLVIGLFFVRRRLNPYVVLAVYAAITASLIGSIFGGIFPACFIPGEGLTPFKIASEYTICLILVVFVVLLYRNRAQFDRGVLRLLIASACITIASELAFTMYTDPYGQINRVGHLLKFLSFYLIYLAIIQTGLFEPYRLLFRNLTQAEEELRKTLHELERSNRELEQFAHIASHDLQEPMRMVSGFMDLLARKYKGQLDEKADEYIGFAVEGARRMQQLLTALLAYSRVTTRAQPFRPTDCEAILAKAMENLQLVIKDSGAAVTHDPLPTLPADETQLTQLFQNLLSNAIKFRGEQPPSIHVSARPENGAWLFSVRDNGIGIAPEQFERVFQIFQRVCDEEAYPGTGIGLAVCKKIVERHRGRIWVESEPGRETTFHFSLPSRGLRES
jgi:signal transduction histidine kinase